ncbi:MAG: PepSY-like domain-containing protein, partial [Verrucomicrobiota bacterium]|nr:PepSY-like domain-containing protein [Verrucomicrobiota bacterium]
PDPVLKTLKAQLGGSHVSDFTPETVDGKKFYHFGFKQGGKFVHVKIDSNGALIHKNDKPLPAASAAAPGAVAATAAAPEAAAATPSPDGSSKVTFAQLPPAAQQTVRAQLGSAEINDIDKETKNGKTVYEVGSKTNGQQKEIRVAEDGTFLGLVSPAPAGPAPTPATPPAVSGKVTFDQIPAAVQNTVKSQINPSEINDIDREVKPGKQTVYEVGFKRNGQQTELRINEDGTMEQK